MSDILDRILAVKRDELRALDKNFAMQGATEQEWLQFKRDYDRRGPRRSLVDALRRPPGAPVRVLSEIKRASPSAGPIRPDADPVAVAREYADAGAAAISVLTDRMFFDGDIAFVQPVRDAVAVPVLRKDFLIDVAQLEESRRACADAVLLIVAALAPLTLQIMLREAHRMELDTLVEVHSLAELDIAMAAPRQPSLIGVNHRNLRTFEIDMTLTEQIAKRVPADVVLVAESGIKTADDVKRLGDAGAHAVLVGEHLMRASSPGAALRELLQ